MKSDLTDITIVLDRSGSMGSVREATIEAVNGYVASQRELPGECTLTLVQFDDLYQVDQAGVPIGEYKPLGSHSYQPRGATALRDAICKTIIDNGKRFAEMDEQGRPGTVIFVIQTDGMENASKEFSTEDVNRLISEHRDKWNWQFVFLGANQDAIASAREYGIPTAAAANYAHSDEGTRNMFGKLAASTSKLRSARSAGDQNASYSFDSK